MTVRELKDLLNETDRFDNAEIILYNLAAEEDCICKSVELTHPKVYNRYTKGDSAVKKVESNCIVVLCG